MKASFILLIFVIAMPAFASTTITMSGTMSLLPGNSDPHGFDSSTWTFVFVTNDTQYSNVGSFAQAVYATAELTIDNATNPVYNTTFTLPGGSYATFPNILGTAELMLDLGGGAASLTFGTPLITVLDFEPDGPSTNPLATPGDPVLASDFNGITVVDDDVLINGEEFEYNATVTAIPEPAAGLVLIIGATLLSVRRHRTPVF